MVWASLFTPSSFFLRHVLIFSTWIFPYCRKVVTTLWISWHFYVVDECCHNIMEMFSYVLRQHCSNTLVTFLKYVAATSCANVSQLSLNVVTMCLQLSSMTLRQHQVGTFSQLLMNIWAIFLQYGYSIVEENESNVTPYYQWNSKPTMHSAHINSHPCSLSLISCNFTNAFLIWWPSKMVNPSRVNIFCH